MVLVAVMLMGGILIWSSADANALVTGPTVELSTVELDDVRTVSVLTDFEDTDAGDIFIDSSGMPWRVLHKDAAGNRLIITEFVHVFSQYNTNRFWVPLALSPIRNILNNWPLAPEIAENARTPIGVGHDVRSTTGNFNPNENQAAGRTSPGALIPAANASTGLFLLSVSEVNQYFANDGSRMAFNANYVPNLVPAYWWLRSPGGTGAQSEGVLVQYRPVAISTQIPSTTHGGVRPALWVNSAGCNYEGCTCDPCNCVGDECRPGPGCTCNDCTCGPCNCGPGCTCDPGCTCGTYPCDCCDTCGTYPCNCCDICGNYPCDCHPELHPRYMFGDEYGNFLPTSQITRAQVATILARTQLLDFEEDVRRLPPGMTSFTAFSDVGPNNWFYFYVAWAYDADLVQGYQGRFRPNEPITRQELAAMIARMDTVYQAGAAGFIDAGDASNWAVRYVYTVYRRGLMQGDDRGRFQPLRDITRAETATTVNRLLGRIDGREAWGEAYVASLYNIRHFPDMRTAAWYFPSVVAAANDHFLTRDDAGTIDWKQILP